MRTLLVTHPDCRRHAMEPGHPECPERIDAIADELEHSGIAPLMRLEDAPIATDEQLARVHAREHIARIRAMAPSAGLATVGPDVTMNAHSLDAALRAAGALILATDRVATGAAEAAFCNVRPPGHHAECASAMGFCLFNNVAVGIAHALAEHGLERLAVIDFDVHHGNGTEEIFTPEPRVLMCSIYQWPLYPGIPGARSPGHMVNVALSPGTGGAGLRDALDEHWRPEIERFRPQMLFISAGFDAHRDDPLASLTFGARDYAWVTAQLVAMMRELGSPRIVSTLEGGYALGPLARSAAAHVRALVEG